MIPVSTEWREAYDASHYLRVEEDSPLRCQCVTAQGQCRIIAVPGSAYCVQHCGCGIAKREAKEKIRNYQLTKWKAAVGDKADSSVIKDITEEIGILRTIIETKLNQCNDETELMLNSQSIANMVMQASTLVNQLQMMETKLNQMLSTSQALQFADEIVEIIARHVENGEAREAISNEIIAVLSR